MQDKKNKNISQTQKTETPTVMDSDTANIIICYLLYQIDIPVQKEHLYDIAVGSNVINYFFYQESIDYLLNNDMIQKKPVSGIKETVEYKLTQQGKEFAKQAKDKVGKEYLDKIVSVAFQYFAQIKRQSELKVDYIPLHKGYYVHIRCLDEEAEDLLDMKLYAPDIAQAKYLGAQIMRNPSGFYGKILNAAWSNEDY